MQGILTPSVNRMTYAKHSSFPQMFSLNSANSVTKILLFSKRLLCSNPLPSCVRDRDSTTVPQTQLTEKRVKSLILIHASVIYQIL